jgi:hypothetical protein
VPTLALPDADEHLSSGVAFLPAKTMSRQLCGKPHVYPQRWYAEKAYEK